MSDFPRYWVTGPSGVGKTMLVEELRSSGVMRGFDLDFVGYRLASEGWDRWHIPTQIFSVMAKVADAEQRPTVVTGCDSQPDAMWRAALAFGFEPVIIIPTLEELETWRRKRGDKPEKVAEAARSIESWTRHAMKWSARIVSSYKDVIA